MLVDYKTEIDQACRSDRLGVALSLAQQWTREDRRSPKAWSKLAYVFELNRAFDRAANSIKEALSLSPAHPPYLFKLGVFEFRTRKFSDAMSAFEQCMAASLNLQDDYYLDAARVARARCLIECGRSQDVEAAVHGLSDDAATWLDGRITAANVRALASKQTLSRKIRMRPDGGV